MASISEAIGDFFLFFLSPVPGRSLQNICTPKKKTHKTQKKSSGRFLQNICTQVFLFFFLLPRSWVVPAKQIAFSFFLFPGVIFYFFIFYFLPARASILAQPTGFSTPAGAFMPAQPQGFSTPARASILAQPQGFRTWRGFTYTILGKTPARPA